MNIKENQWDSLKTMNLQRYQKLDQWDKLNLFMKSELSFLGIPAWIMGNQWKLHEHRKKRPTKKINNRFRPPETYVGRRQGQLARPKRSTKRNLTQNELPFNGVSIWPMRFFPRRHAGHDLGVENNRIDLKRPYLPQLVCMLGCFFLPSHEI